MMNRIHLRLIVRDMIDIETLQYPAGLSYVRHSTVAEKKSLRTRLLETVLRPPCRLDRQRQSACYRFGQVSKLF